MNTTTQQNGNLMNVLYWDNDAEAIELTSNAFAARPGFIIKGVVKEKQFLTELKARKWDFILLDLLNPEQERNEEDYLSLSTTCGYKLARNVREAGYDIPILFVTDHADIIELGIEEVQPAFIDAKNAPKGWIASRIRQLDKLYRELHDSKINLAEVEKIRKRRLWVTALLLMLFLGFGAYALSSHAQNSDSTFLAVALMACLGVSGGLGAAVSDILNPKGGTSPLVSVIVGAVVGSVLGLTYIIPLCLHLPDTKISGITMILGSLVSISMGGIYEHAWRKLQQQSMKVSGSLSAKACGGNDPKEKGE